MNFLHTPRDVIFTPSFTNNAVLLLSALELLMFCCVNTADSQMTHETYTFTLRANVYSVLEVNRASLSFLHTGDWCHFLFLARVLQTLSDLYYQLTCLSLCVSVGNFDAKYVGNYKRFRGSCPIGTYRKVHTARRLVTSSMT